MKIFVKIGTRNTQYDVTVDDTVLNLKEMIAKRRNISVTSLFLLFKGRNLHDNSCLKHYSIWENDVINVLEYDSSNLEQMDNVQSSESLPRQRTTVSLGESESNMSMTSIGSSSEDCPSINFDKCPGICGIFNNENFQMAPGHTKALERRLGTIHDEKRIKEEFEKLGYTIKLYKDVVSTNVVSIIREIKDVVKSFHKNLIIFVLSHGDDNCIFFSDGLPLSFEMIWKPFTNANFSSFAGHPKIFFFSGCQGNKVNVGVNTHDDTLEDTDLKVDGEYPKRDRIPGVADMFFGYATYRSFVAWRLESEGTLYIQALCDVIKDNKDKSISDIHQETQRIVSKRAFNENKDFQMPYFTNLLIDHAYL